MTRRILIVGAGIVGSALAAGLAEVGQVSVTVLEAGPADQLLGSTGHAPGFVGLLNEAPVLTDLAVASVRRYEQCSRGAVPGFERVGGLEVALTEAGLDELHRRAALAGPAGLAARPLDAAQTVAQAPELIAPRGCVGGVLYPEDGTARADVITAALRDRAARAGAHFVYQTAVTALDIQDGRIHGARTGTARFDANDVVLACGIWGPVIAAPAGLDLPLVPVEHPYVYGPVRERAGRTPFVRWPERHVYARDHGERIGVGSYDHAPLPVDPADLGSGAQRPFRSDVFDPVIDRALELLPASARFVPEHRLNGVFAMTPDNLPLLGPVADVPGLWVAAAIWVTHAAGAADALAAMMTGQDPGVTELRALHPQRFRGEPRGELRERALRRYRDIYATA